MSFDNKSVRKTISDALASFSVNESQEGVTDMIDHITEAVLDIYNTASQQKPDKKPAKKGKGNGGGNAYTRFIGHMAANSNLVNLKVHLHARFPANATTKEIYTKHQDQFEDGEEITIGNLLERIEHCFAEENRKANKMSTHAFVWNILDDENRQLVMSSS